MEARQDYTNRNRTVDLIGSLTQFHRNSTVKTTNNSTAKTTPSLGIFLLLFTSTASSESANLGFEIIAVGSCRREGFRCWDAPLLLNSSRPTAAQGDWGQNSTSTSTSLQGRRQHSVPLPFLAFSPQCLQGANCTARARDLSAHLHISKFQFDQSTNLRKFEDDLSKYTTGFTLS